MNASPILFFVELANIDLCDSEKAGFTVLPGQRDDGSMYFDASIVSDGDAIFGIDGNECMTFRGASLTDALEGLAEKCTAQLRAAGVTSTMTVTAAYRALAKN